MGVQIQGDTGNVIATKGTYSGNVTVGGTLTYEDVTNIDSVGLVTARQGIEVGARPGVAASISVDGNMIVSGISTFGGKVLPSSDSSIDIGTTSVRFQNAYVDNYYGSGANLTGIAATDNVRTGILDVAGIATFRDDVLVGSAVTISESGVAIAGAGITVANINGGQVGGRRNLIINGDMSQAQRGTSFSPTGTDQIYTLDRFEHVATSGVSADCTVTQNQSYNISGVGDMKSYKITPDSTDTATGGGNLTIRYQVEGQDLQHLEYGTSNAKPITISFFAKTASANNGDQYALCLFHSRSSDAAQRTINVPFTATSSWQRFAFTFPGDTDSSYDIVDTTASGMTLTWILDSGPDDIMAQKSAWATDGGYFRAVTGQSNFMDSTSNEFFLTGVQMEIGDTATNFEKITFAENERLCFRYYQSEDFATLMGSASGAVSTPRITFPIKMRVAPTTFTVNYNSNGSGSFRNQNDGSTMTGHTTYTVYDYGFAARGSSGSSNILYSSTYFADAEI